MQWLTDRIFFGIFIFLCVYGLYAIALDNIRRHKGLRARLAGLVATLVQRPPTLLRRAALSVLVWLLRPSTSRETVIGLAANGDIVQVVATTEFAPGNEAFLLNDAINASINAGRYRAALGYEAHIPAPSGTLDDTANRVIIQINLAEAEYNLGEWAAAERRLAPLDAAAECLRLCRAGLRTQRSWIYALTGRATEALTVLQTVEPRWFPSDYVAEYWFTLARAQLSAGLLDECDKSLDRAETSLVRSSSKRNHLFLRAHLAQARGDLQAASRLCEQAASHEYKGQGAEGLVLWGDVLTKLGDSAGAARAWQLAIDRDGESEWAQVAKKRLTQSSAGPTVPGAA
ncbi:MAG: hypothetical protein JST92_12080 [Deltaproteobacteria bacterium]|nr:hypothetical protein [Deltaproteobacteria bacterium]